MHTWTHVHVHGSHLNTCTFEHNTAHNYVQYTCTHRCSTMRNSKISATLSAYPSTSGERATIICPNKGPKESRSTLYREKKRKKYTIPKYHSIMYENTSLGRHGLKFSSLPFFPHFTELHLSPNPILPYRSLSSGQLRLISRSTHFLALCFKCSVLITCKSTHLRMKQLHAERVSLVISWYLKVRQYLT